MKTFAEYILEGYGKVDESGAGIARVLSKLEDENDFLIITAFRGNLSKKENLVNNNKLIKDLRNDLDKKVGAYKLVGHWKECTEPLKDNEKISDCKGSIKDSLEESWLIIRPNEINQKDFINVAQSIAQKYNQDAYVIRINGKLTLNGKDGTEWEDLGIASKKSISNGFGRILDLQGYSELKKNRNKGRSINIIFEDLSIKIPDDTNSSKRLFSSANILF